MSVRIPGHSWLRATLKQPAVGRLGLIAALLLIWEVLARTVADPAFVSPPTAIFHALPTRTLADPTLLIAIGTTFWELLLAFCLAVLVGAAIGVLVGSTEWVRRSAFPLVLMLYAVPQVTVLPLFVMFFGPGATSKVAFGFTHGIFPIIVNVVAGMRDINPVLLRSARSMGARGAQVLRHVIFPHLVPSFFAGMRLSMAMTLLGVILAELYVSVDGVGYFAHLYSESFDPAALYALIFVLALMAVLLNELARRAELRFSGARR